MHPGGGQRGWWRQWTLSTRETGGCWVEGISNLHPDHPSPPPCPPLALPPAIPLLATASLRCRNKWQSCTVINCDTFISMNVCFSSPCQWFELHSSDSNFSQHWVFPFHCLGFYFFCLFFFCGKYNQVMEVMCLHFLFALTQHLLNMRNYWQQCQLHLCHKQYEPFQQFCCDFYVVEWVWCLPVHSSKPAQWTFCCWKLPCWLCF